MKRVVAFGVFDLLHPGHLYFLEQTKKYGTHLTVVVTRDARVRQEKKHKPFFNERERLEIVSAMKWVDRAVLGDRAGEWNVLMRLKPDVICLGYDQKREWLERSQLQYQPRIVQIKPWQARKYSSTVLKWHLLR
ncbi:MAG: FAD synthase [Parcubacteria group bacterium GW2011_GWC2_45_7]|nr:MAG: FAD synthase [Parcubacteria group bacterium GW2011_GWA2_42_28]KKU12596.1 MAG: FAD synthase [Parcubacteria group bacterium GW2011_GWC2_45_7]